MLPEVVDAYYEEGYRLRMGSPRLPVSGVQRVGEEVYIPDGPDDPPLTDWGFSLRDLYLFELIGRELGPSRLLVIGNAFGVSVNTLGAALRPVTIDAIDAETGGHASREGARLTRRVADRLGLDLRLTAGWSPRDLDAACRFERYGLCFVDGLHTNEQMLADFEGVRGRLEDRCAVVFHDVGLCAMDEAWYEILRRTRGEGFSGHAATFTDFGTCVLLRGLPALDRMLSITCRRLRNANEIYHNGQRRGDRRDGPERGVVHTTAGTPVALVGADEARAEFGWMLEQHPDRVVGVFDGMQIGSCVGGFEVRPLEALAGTGTRTVVLGASAEAHRRAVERLVPDAAVHPVAGLAHPVNIVNWPEVGPRAEIGVRTGPAVAAPRPGPDAA